MAATETGRRKAWLFGGLGVALLALALGLAWQLWPKPQMGADPATFSAVDALFTAVTARDPAAVGRCEARLAALRVAGKLPNGAAKELERVVGMARRGEWEPAAGRLYDFMRAQRREAR